MLLDCFDDNCSNPTRQIITNLMIAIKQTTRKEFREKVLQRKLKEIKRNFRNETDGRTPSNRIDKSKSLEIAR